MAYGAALQISDKLIKERTSMIARDEANPTTTEIKKATMDVMETFLGCMFISSANQKKCGGLKKDLHKNFWMGRDTYPKTMETSTRLLAGYKPAWAPQRVPIKQEDGVAFMQKKQNAPKASTEDKGECKIRLILLQLWKGRSLCIGVPT